MSDRDVNNLCRICKTENNQILSGKNEKKKDSGYFFIFLFFIIKKTCFFVKTRLVFDPVTRLAKTL